MRIGKWVPIAGAVARIVLLGFFLVSVVVFAVQHGVHALPAGEFVPTYAGFVALVPVLIFNYVGFELPSSAAEEMTNPRRDIPLSILRSGFAAVLLYGGPILGILFVLPSKEIGSLGGFIDACKAVFTVYGGSIAADGTVTLTGLGSVFGGVAAAGLIIGLLTSGVTWAMGAHRAQAVACADGAGPAWLGRISEKHGTPVRVNLLSAVLGSILFVVALNLTGGNGEKYFAAGLGLTICTTFISYVITFPSLAVLRRKYPDTPRPYAVPGGRVGAWVVSVLATGFVAFTVIVLIWPGFGVGWFGSAGSAADSLPESFMRRARPVHTQPGGAPAALRRHRARLLRDGRADAQARGQLARSRAREGLPRVGEGPPACVGSRRTICRVRRPRTDSRARCARPPPRRRTPVLRPSLRRFA